MKVKFNPESGHNEIVATWSELLEHWTKPQCFKKTQSVRNVFGNTFLPRHLFLLFVAKLKMELKSSKWHTAFRNQRNMLDVSGLFLVHDDQQTAGPVDLSIK